jgi:hypothetical protein
MIFFVFFSINPTKKVLKFWKNHQTLETTKPKKKNKKNYIQDVEKQFRNWFITKFPLPITTNLKAIHLMKLGTILIH